MKKKKRIFLLYSYADKEIAFRISEELKKRNIEIISDYNNLRPGTNIINELRYLVESSEIVLLILSKNYFESTYPNKELTGFLDETQKRKITIIPILIEKCNLPSDLLDYEVINLSKNFSDGLNKIIQRVQTIPEISFEGFSAYDFEKFIYDLLKEYGFKNVKAEFTNQDMRFDYIGEYSSKNPFGMRKKETWIVEVKFYREERFSINAIRELVEIKKGLLPADIKMLLVTNSILTSVAEEYLNDIQKVENIQIDVIDGLLLKKLVSKRKRLLKKYFQL